MRINERKLGTVLSYLQMGLGTLISLIYTPLMLRLLGQSEYGLYNTVSSTISMLSLLNLGFGSGYVRYYAQYKKENNREAIYRLNGLFLTIFAVIGAVALACGLFISAHLEMVFDSGLTENEYNLARTLMTLLTVNLAVSFPMSVFSNIVSASERFVFLKLLGILKTVVSPLLTVPLLLMGFRSVALVISTMVISLLTDILYLYYVLFVLKNRFIFQGFEPGLLKTLFAYTVFIAMNLVVDQINNNLDKFLLGRFNGTAATAIYSVGFALYHYDMMFSTAICAVFTPRVHLLIQETGADPSLRTERLTELFTKVGRIQFLVLGLVTSGLVFFGKQFIVNIWAGPAYEEAYYVMLLLVLPSMVPFIQNLGIEIQRAQNKHQFRSIAYLIMAAVNFALTVALCPRYGAVGATVGTAISLLLANGLVINIYYHKQCNIDIIAFWKSILRLAAGLLPPILLGLILMVSFKELSILQYLAAIAAYTAVYCLSMWCLGMNHYEKSLVRSAVRAVMKRRKARRT